MIEKVVLQNFKRFRRQEFHIRDSVVLAGPNNCGKTTLIQAIATWRFALNRWKQMRLQRGRASQAKRRSAIPITREAFLVMPLRELNLLWTDTSTALRRGEGKPGEPRIMSIRLEGRNGQGKTWELTMEFRYSNSEMVYAKPSQQTPQQIPPEEISLEEISDTIAYIPSFAGISVDEKIHTREYQDWLIGEGKSGDIIRNLLVEIYEKPKADSNKKTKWEELNQEIEDIFRCRLLPPKYEGLPSIRCDHLPAIPAPKGRGGRGELPKLDIANAGSGFLQTVMLLAFFYARPATTLLIDEPDAHLHFILQGQIYKRLQELARKNGSQLIIATHSEVLINNTAAEKIISFYGEPRSLLDNTSRDAVREALKRLSAIDIALAEKKRILYVEGESDFRILSAWAKILNHPAHKWLEGEEAYYYSMRGRRPQEASAHFFALRALQADMRGMILLDSNNKSEDREPRKDGLQIYRWKRYEIENYLIHQAPIERFMNKRVGSLFGGALFANQVLEIMKKKLPPEVIEKPLGDHDYLKRTPASKELLPVFLEGCNIEKADYWEIASEMKKEEIHQDVIQFLDSLSEALALDQDRH